MGVLRRLRTALPVAVALLLLLEVGVRTVDDRLPEPLEWHSFETQRKVHQIEALAARGGVDVVFLGTSMVNAAVIPAVFDDAAGRGTTSYNAALSSGIPRLMEVWATHVVFPALHPRLVVIGVSSNDLTDAGVARTAFLDAFEDSPAGRDLLDRQTIVDRADRWLGARSALFAHRAELREPSTVLDVLAGRPPTTDPVAASIDDGGFVANLRDRTFDERPTRDGIAGVSVWSPGREDPAAILRTVAAARDQGAEVVMVAMPVTDEYIAFHPRGIDDYRDAMALARQLASDAGVELLELDDDRDHDHFADELHLNGTGARLFSQRLAAALAAVDALPD